METRKIADIWKLYIKEIKDEIDILNTNISQTKENIRLINSYLSINKEWIETNTNITVKEIRSLLSIDDKLSIVFAVYADRTLKGQAERNIRSLIDSKKQLKKLELKLEKLKKEKIDYSTFKYIVSVCNTEFRELILEEGIKDFSFGHNTGGIYIKETNTNFETYKTRSTAINWGESNKLREEIVKEKDINLYNAYKGRQIKRKEFELKARKYCYHKTENPNGIKWYVYRQDESSFWWWWNKGKATIKNAILYSFTPSKAMHEKDTDGSQILFNKLKDNVRNGIVKRDEIKNLNIGSMFQLRLYLDVFPEKKLAYRDDK